VVEWSGTVVLTTPRLLLRTFRRDDGAFLGMCGLHHQESYPDDVEVAWRLAREHWGQGYATEAATGWLDHITAEQWRRAAAARRSAVTGEE
jgi:RimJ/RimL family protein N-acetyltransferase